MSVHPAQGSAPQKPLVDVAHQYGGQRPVAFEHGEQALDLIAPLVRLQAEVRREDAHRRPTAVEFGIDRAARLAPLDAEIDALHRKDLEAREQAVTVVRAAA